MKIITIYLSIAIIVVSSCSINSLSTDFELFEGKYYTLARQVQNCNCNRISHMLSDDEIDVNYQEGNFGYSLLMIAVKNNLEGAVSCLLRNGANPNLYNKEGDNALLIASGILRNWNKDIDVLELLLEHGANPNLNSKYNEENFWDSPLKRAAFCCFEKTVKLVEMGADINFGNISKGSVLYSSLISRNNPEITRFLFENGLDIYQPVTLTIQGDTLWAEDFIEKWDFESGTEAFIFKKELLNDLNSR